MIGFARFCGFSAQQRNPLAVERPDGQTLIEHALQRTVRGRVGAGALPGDVAALQHHQLIGLQRQ